MRIQWRYDVPAGEEIEVDVSDFEGKSAAEVEKAIVLLCIEDLRASARCYIPQLDAAVRAIVAGVDVDL